MPNKTPSPWSVDFYRTNIVKDLNDTIEHTGVEGKNKKETVPVYEKQKATMIQALVSIYAGKGMEDEDILQKVSESIGKNTILAAVGRNTRNELAKEILASVRAVEKKKKEPYVSKEALEEVAYNK